MITPSPIKPLFVLATRTRHTIPMLGQPIEYPANPSLNRGIQIERTCSRCGVVRVIVLCDGPGGAAGLLRWRASEDAIEQVAEDPGCVADEVVMGRVGT